MKLVVLALVLLICTSSFAITVVNSLDGRDLISGIYYSAVTNDTLVFATPGSTAQDMYGQIGSGQNITLIQSTANPVIVGLADGLTNAGNTVTIIQSSDPMATNLKLAGMSAVHKFVIVDPVYGYNTVSTLPYAKLNGMYLIFMDRDNAANATALMKAQGATDILIYGYVDPGVTAAITGAGLVYRQINNGDEFDDNAQIIDMYFAQNPSKHQVILSDGNAFDSTMATGNDPIILISPVIPDSVYQYIKAKVASGQIIAAMLVDQSYAQTAYNLKTSINKDLGKSNETLSVFVKFGESITSAGGQMNQVALFPLPGPTFGLSISAIDYNTVKQQLEVTYSNTGNALEYVQPSMQVFDDGAMVGTVGDEQPFSIPAGQELGRDYPIKIQEGKVSANITAYFGSSKKTFQNGIQVMMDAGSVQYVDSSQLNITQFTRDSDTDDLLVTYANTGNVTLYFTAAATIDANGTSTTINDDNNYQLAPGEGHMVKFPGIATMGSTITASANYGSRQAFLEKSVQAEYTPQETGNSTLLIAGVVIIILVVIAAAFFFLRKKEKPESKKEKTKK